MDLAWTASTDADGDPVTYDLYLGVGSLPGTPTVTGLTSAGYDPGVLAALSAYHWRVVSMDPFGGSTPGPEWTFTTTTTASPTPPRPSPANGAVNWPVDVNLAWAASTDPDGDPGHLRPLLRQGQPARRRHRGWPDSQPLRPAAPRCRTRPTTGA